MMKKYSKWTKQTQSYLEDVEDYLLKRYGEVPSEWNATLFLLADNLDLYNQCKESVKANGIYNAESGKKNPLLATMKDLQATIIKQIQHLGLSPYAAAKITDREEDDSELLKNIIGEE